jgi:hypothetical protein
MLHIEAESRQEEKREEKGYLRREVRYGPLSRSLPLPEGVTEADITANYKDGVLRSASRNGFAMRGSSRTSSPVICRGVAVTAARWAGEENRPAGGWRSCS